MEKDQDPNNVIELEVDGRVSVFWKESGHSFEGTVEKVHPDGSCDVVYDALIQGSICRENHVSKDRITVINTMDLDDTYWNDTQQSTYPQNDLIESLQTSLSNPNTTGNAVTSPTKPNSAISGLLLEHNPIVIKICQLSAKSEETVTLEDLEDHELKQLNECEGAGAGHHGGRQQAYYVDGEVHSFLSTDSGDRPIGTGGTTGEGGLGGTGGGREHHLSKSALQDVEEALVETAKEADRQKRFVERQSHNLKHRLHTHEKESRLKNRHRLHENSDLLFECNELRAENRDLLRKLQLAEHDLDEAKRTLHSMKGVASTMSTQPASKPSTAEKPKKPRSAHKPDGGAGAGKGTASSASPWIVHNSLPVPNPISGPGSPGRPHHEGKAGGGPKIGLEIHNRREDDQESLHSLQGLAIQQSPLPLPQSHKTAATTTATAGGISHPLAQSMPNLSLETSGSVLPQLSTSQSLLPLQQQNQSLQQLHTNQGKVQVTKSQSTSKIGVSLNLPKANKLRTVEGNIVDKLTTEIDSLARQLDDSLRERDIQRLELSRLRKQLMHLTNQQQFLQSQLSSHPKTTGAFLEQASAGGGVALQMSSVHSSYVGVESSLPSIGNGSGNGGGGSLPPVLTHADLYGYPSEEDKKEMMIGPAGKGSSNSSHNNNSIQQPQSKSRTPKGQKAVSALRASNPLIAAGSTNSFDLSARNSARPLGSARDSNNKSQSEIGGNGELQQLSLQSHDDHE